MKAFTLATTLVCVTPETNSETRIDLSWASKDKENSKMR